MWRVCLSTLLVIYDYSITQNQAVNISTCSVGLGSFKFAVPLTLSQSVQCAVA